MTRQPSLKHRLQVPLTADRRQWPRWRYAPRGLFQLNSLHSPLDVVDGSFEAVDALDVFPSVSITRNVPARWSAMPAARAAEWSKHMAAAIRIVHALIRSFAPTSCS